MITSGRGKYSRARIPKGYVADVALDATIRAAVGRMLVRQGGVVEILPEDLREKLRRHSAPFVISFVLDNSWSVHVDAALARVKGVVLDLLRDAHVRHDKVALVVFRHGRCPTAAVSLPPTRSYAVAAERLRRVSVSGSSPLPDAIRKAYHLLRTERVKCRTAIPVMAIVTDGLPNVPIRAGGDPFEEVAMLCCHLRREGIATLVVDTEPQGADAGRSGCRRMAALAKGRYLPLSELTRLSVEDAAMSG